MDAVLVGSADVAHLVGGAPPRRGRPPPKARLAGRAAQAPGSANSRPKDASVLGAILALAAALRLVGIEYGLPFGDLLNPDEQNIVPRAWEMVHGGGLDPHWFDYPVAAPLRARALPGVAGRAVVPDRPARRRRVRRRRRRGRLVARPRRLRQDRGARRRRAVVRRDDRRRLLAHGRHRRADDRADRGLARARSHREARVGGRRRRVSPRARSTRPCSCSCRWSSRAGGRWRRLGDLGRARGRSPSSRRARSCSSTRARRGTTRAASSALRATAGSASSTTRGRSSRSRGSSGRASGRRW